MTFSLTLWVVFELESPKNVVTRVYVTTTADKVYGMPPRDVGELS